jgi:hypothetical protein
VPFVKLCREDSAEIAMHFADHGAGRPLVLVHVYRNDGDSPGAVAST